MTDRWYATQSPGTPFVSHLLVTANALGAMALCGDRLPAPHPVEEFARPELFSPCSDCRAARDQEAVYTPVDLEDILGRHPTAG